MASSLGGYAADRPTTTVDKNFLCPICADVLKDPVQCQNQHYFCRACLKKHLEKNAKSCPICVQCLSEETLVKPPRILTDYLNSLMITCDHSERGCTETVSVSGLETHVLACDYRPVVCTNDGCGQTFNQKDLVDHVIRTCDFRMVHCDDCEEDMTQKKFGKHACLVGKDVNKMKVEWLEIRNTLAKICDSLQEILNAVQSTADDEQSMAGSSQPASPKVTANIMVIGGRNEIELNSVEVLYPHCKTWTTLQSMQECRGSASSVLYGNEVIVTGGRCNQAASDTIERVSLVSKPLKWITFPVKLPLKCCGHKVVVINNCLFLVGGYQCDDGTVSAAVYSILLHPPYTIELKCIMPQPICFHGLQAFEESFFIFGGSKTCSSVEAVNTVSLYNTVNTDCKVMRQLPFAVCDVATVRWNDNIIIIGGTSKSTVSLNTVSLYNVKENTHKMLPSMKHARSSCAATIAGNKVFVMGGFDWCERKYLNSVECFDLDRQVWEELPAMNEPRSEATAVVYAGFC